MHNVAELSLDCLIVRELTLRSAADDLFVGRRIPTTHVRQDVCAFKLFLLLQSRVFAVTSTEVELMKYFLCSEAIFPVVFAMIFILCIPLKSHCFAE